MGRENMEIVGHRTRWGIVAAFAAAIALLALAGCEDGKSSTTSGSTSGTHKPDAPRVERNPSGNTSASRSHTPRSTHEADKPDNSADRTNSGDAGQDDGAEKPLKPWTEGEKGAPPKPLKLIDTSNMDKVAGVKEKRGVKLSGDVLYSLYDVGHSRKSGVSRTIIHVFPESSRKYRKLAIRPEGWIAKRIPDEDMNTMLEAGEKDKFAQLLRPMTQDQLEAEFAAGNSVITLEEDGRMRGAVRPKIKEGGSEDDMKRWEGMKSLFMAIARAYITPTISGGTGPSPEFKQPGHQ